MNEQNAGLRLRNLSVNDFGLLVKIETDPDNLVYSGLIAPPDLDDLIALITDQGEFNDRKQKRFTIEFNTQAIGFVDLFDADFDSKSCYVGIFVLPDFRMKKIALNALQLLQNEARKFNLMTLNAKCMNQNLASIALFRKAGFNTESSTNEFVVLQRSIDF